MIDRLEPVIIDFFYENLINLSGFFLLLSEANKEPDKKIFSLYTLITAGMIEQLFKDDRIINDDFELTY